MIQTWIEPSLSLTLAEEGGRDLSCVVSSLAQLMMDPHYRSISGFQALVQKDWVAMGHPFSTRHHLITKPPSLSPDSVTDEPSVEVNSQHETIRALPLSYTLVKLIHYLMT